MVRILILFSLLVISVCGYGQETNWSSIKKFIPKGYDTLDGGFVKGDLNKDGKGDVVLALRSDKEKEEDFYEGDRLLIVLIKKQQPNINLQESLKKY